MADETPPLEVVIPPPGVSTHDKLMALLWAGAVFTKLPRNAGYTVAYADRRKDISTQDFQGVIDVAYTFYTETNSPPIEPVPDNVLNTEPVDGGVLVVATPNDPEANYTSPMVSIPI